MKNLLRTFHGQYSESQLSDMPCVTCRPVLQSGRMQRLSLKQFRVNAKLPILTVHNTIGRTCYSMLHTKQLNTALDRSRKRCDENAGRLRAFLTIFNFTETLIPQFKRYKYDNFVIQ